MRITLITSLLLLLPTLCLASPQGKQEKVDLLLEAMDASSMVDSIYSQMESMMGNMAKQLNVRPEEETIFEKYQRQLVKIVEEEVSWEKFKAPMTKIYVKHYTEQELDDMIAFYQSETGQSMVKKMPHVMQESILLSQSMMQGLLPKIQSLSKELGVELKDFRDSQ